MLLGHLGHFMKHSRSGYRTRNIWIHFLKLWILCSVLCTKYVSAKVVYGHLLTGENWRFLARFCFLSLHGKFEYDVQYDASYGVQNIDLYYDTASQWARVYGDRADLTSCRQKESVLKVRLFQNFIQIVFIII